MKKRINVACKTFQAAHDELAEACRETGITTTKDDRELLALEVAAKVLRDAANGVPVMTTIRNIRKIATEDTNEKTD